MIDNTYTLGMIQLNVNLSAEEFVQVRDARINNAPMILQDHAAGHPDPLFITQMGAKPDITCKTTQVWLMLNSMINLSSQIIQANPVQSADDNTVDLFFRRMGFASTRDPDASTVHARFRLTHGIMYWTGLRASFQQLAELDIRIKPLSTDGVTSPLVYTGNNAYNAPNTYQEAYTLGKIKLGSTVIDGNLEVSIDPSVQLEELGSDMDLFDTFAAISERSQPKITIRGVHIDWWEDYAPNAASGALTIWLRKKVKDAHHLAEGTAEHIKIFSAYGVLVAESIAGQHNRPGEITLCYYPRVQYDNEPLLQITQAAIT
jgi:hypothetical protein